MTRDIYNVCVVTHMQDLHVKVILFKCQRLEINAETISRLIDQCTGLFISVFFLIFAFFLVKYLMLSPLQAPKTFSKSKKEKSLSILIID